MSKKDKLTGEGSMNSFDQELRAAIKEAFTQLYVKEFTTDWQAQRTVRCIEIDILDLAAIKQSILDSLDGVRSLWLDSEDNALAVLDAVEKALLGESDD